jgi:dihydropyrimidinase
MTYDMIIRGGDVVFPRTGVCATDLAIRDGRIAALFSPGSRELNATEIIDAKGLTIFPGVIDPHVHTSVSTSPNAWLTETTSGVIGGVTTVLDFQMGVEGYAGRFERDRSLAEKSSRVDFGFQFIIATEEQLAELPIYVNELGVPSFKMFMSYKGDEGAYLGVPGTDDGFLFELLEQVAALSAGPLSLHTENIEVVWRLRDRIQKQGKNDLAAFTESRPPFVEAEDIHKAIHYAHVCGCPIHIVHLTSEEAHNAITLGRQQYPGVKVTSETGPQYLTMDCESNVGVLARVNPPVKYARDSDALWLALNRGEIETIGTDHVSRDLKAKLGAGGGKDVWKTQSGFPGIGTSLPLLLSEGFHKSRLSLERIAEVTSYNVAKLYGLAPLKGVLEVGSDADFAIVDLNLEKTITPELVQSWCDWNLWDGWKVKGWPVRTILRGKTIMLDGKAVGDAGFGKYIARPVPSKNSV